jgi:hypothetical protein
MRTSAPRIITVNSLAGSRNCNQSKASWFRGGGKMEKGIGTKGIVMHRYNILRQQN